MGWTALTQASVETLDNLNVDLMTDIVDNKSFLFDSACRAGTFAIPVRLAMARGAVDLGAADNATDTAAVVFADDADDGDPNFSAAPVVLLGLEEDSSGGLADWESDDTVVERVFINDSSLSATGFTIEAELNTGAASNWGITVNWIALGAVTSGE